MFSLKNKPSLKTFGLVYSFEYDFKCHYSTIAPGQYFANNISTYHTLIKIHEKKRLNSIF